MPPTLSSRRLFAAVCAVWLLVTASAVSAQDYMLPNAPGKSEVVETCETCHGIMTVVLHKRSPQQWDVILQQMAALGAVMSEEERGSIRAYLNSYLGQAKDYIPQPMPQRGRGPGVVLALEAAETAQATCRAKGQQVTTLVVDTAGVPVVLLNGDGAPTILASIAATKTATVLRFKESSGAVMNRLNTDPALAAQLKNDPEIGEVRQGGLPIVVEGELIGAIAVAGAFGPANTDEICAQAGLDRIASRLQESKHAKPGSK